MKRNFSYLSMNWLIHEINHAYAAETAKYAKGRLLDVGCGTKPYLEILKKRVSEYVGLDHQDTVVKSEVIDVYGDAQALPFGDSSFGTVVSFQVIEHVREPWVALDEMYRVLSPGGYLIVTTPFMWGIHDEPHDYFRFTGFGLSHLAERAGFQVVEVRPLGGFWITAGLRFNYYIYARARRFRKIFTPLFLFNQIAAKALNRVSFGESDACSYGLVAIKPQTTPDRDS